MQAGKKRRKNLFRIREEERRSERERDGNSVNKPSLQLTHFKPQNDVASKASFPYQTARNNSSPRHVEQQYQCPATHTVRDSTASTPERSRRCHRRGGVRAVGHPTGLGEGEGARDRVTARATVRGGQGQQSPDSTEEVGSFRVHWAMDRPIFHDLKP